MGCYDFFKLVNKRKIIKFFFLFFVVHDTTTFKCRGLNAHKLIINLFTLILEF